MQIWAETGKSALPIRNYSHILYQFLMFTQNLKRSRAICLKNIEAAFSMTDENNALNGLMRRTGFYIKETGECASISQIDLAM